MTYRLKDLNDQWLIKEHFFGIYKTDTTGETEGWEVGQVYLADPTNPDSRIPKSVLNNSIRAAIARIEKLLKARIRKKEHIIEYHDYDRDLYDQYSFVSLREYPVYKVNSFGFYYGENGNLIWDVPLDMIQIKGASSNFGTIEVLPFTTTASEAGVVPIPIFWRSFFNDINMPSIIKVDYNVGMEGDDADIEDDLVRAIGLFGSISPFNILGDIIVGAGIATQSLSFDGISYSVNTTASAENSAMSARIRAYERELFGERGQPGLLKNLQKIWHRVGLGLL